MAKRQEESRTPLRVLIVEDSEDDALLILRELERGGYEPEHERVETPEAMKKALLSSRWDAIISDYHMPRFGAPEALALLHKSGEDVPFIVVSGKVREDVAVEMMKSGAHDYVMKDNLARLCATVERGLEEAEERRELRRTEKEMRRHDAILQAVSFAAERFLSSPGDWERGIEEVLERLGEAAEASRVYIFKNHTGEDGELWNTQLHKWEVPGVPPGLPARRHDSWVTDFPYRDDGTGRWADFGRWEEVLGRGEPMYGNTREFPESERSFLRGTLGILSMILMPIFVEEEWWGFIGFDDCTKEREWSVAEVDALKAAASTLGAALQRQVTEEQLRASEARYRAVIEQATDGMYLLDAATKRLLETNPSFQKMLGYTADELQGMEVYDFVAHSRENVDSTIRRTLEQRRRLVGGRKYRRKDGSLVDVEVGVSVISLGGKDVICTIVRDITERKRSEEALKESEARHRAVVDTALDAIVTMSADGLIRSFNHSAKRIFGYMSEEAIGQRLELLMPERFRELHRAGLRRYLKTGEAHVVGRRRLELAGRRKDGTEFPLELSISETREGEDVLFIGIVRDITERKRSEEALKESEKRFRQLFEHSIDAVFVHNEEGRIVDCNAEACRSLRYTREELLALNVRDIATDLISEEEKRTRKRETLWERAMRSSPGEIVGFDQNNLWRKDGTTLPVEVGVGVIDYGGQRLILASARDITERKRSEEELKESEERFKGLAEATFEGVAITQDGQIVETNTAFAAMFGYEPSEVIGMTPADFHPHESQEAVRNARSSGLEEPYEAVCLRKDSTTFDGEIRGKMSLYKGHLVRVTAIRDITERKRAEEALRISETRFRTMIEQSPLSIQILSPDGRTLQVNRAWEELWGTTLDDIAGYNMLEDQQLIAKGIMPYIKRGFSGEPTAIPPIMYDVDETVPGITSHEEPKPWVRAFIYPVKDEAGDIREVVLMHEDITERKRAEEALKQSEQLYRTVIEQVTENICLVDVESRLIVGANPAFQEALGYTREELRNLTLYDFVAHDRENIDRNIRRIMEEGHSFLGERQYRRKDGSLLDVEVNVSTILRDGRETWCVVAHDVTERARIQKLLEERVATLSGIAASLTLDLPVGDTLNVLAEGVVNASTAVASLVILTGEKTDTLHPVGSHGLPEGYTAGLQAAYSAGVQSPTIEAFRRRRPMLVRDFRRFALNKPLYAPIHNFVREVPWDILYIVPLISRGRALGAINLCYLPEQEPGEDEKVFLGAVADQTAVAVENVRLFASVRGKAALEERQRLARELHDSVSQALYGIALGAKTARTLLDKNPDRVADPLDYVLSLSEAGLAEMRALIFELRPESLETEGLVAALKKQAAALKARHEIEVDAVLCEEPEASLEAKETVYRIAQEALHNTVKHARATRVEIKMECDPEWITLSISDDGVGFDAQSDFPGHLGLRSMRERASRLGGTLEVETAPGRGAQICARIPV